MRAMQRLFALALWFFIWHLPAIAQVDRARVMVAYINNLANYTTWPDQYLPESFNIVVISANAEINDAFTAFARGRSIKGKPVSLIVHDRVPGTIKAHLILLTREQSGSLGIVNDMIGSDPVLVVSEQYHDRREVMINLYENEAHELLFEVNEANIANQNLAIDPEVLLAGGSTLDVARLYRESQQSLRGMMADMESLSDSLTKVSNEIILRMAEAGRYARENEQQRQLLEDMESELRNFEMTILAQRAMLAGQRDSIAAQMRILEMQRNEIAAQAGAFESLKGEWERLEETLGARQEMINSLDREIAEKNEAMGKQSDIIIRQRYFLLLLGFSGLLTLILIINIYTGFRKNKKKNKLLSQQRTQIIQKLAELQELNERLERADHYKSIFLASMSHELRTPLNSIIGYTGILLMGMAGELNEEQKIQLTKVKNNGSHLLSLINDVLDISKIEAGKVELSCEEFELADVIQEVVDIAHPKAIEKNLKVDTRSDEFIKLYTDKRRLKQVLLNLVSNAVNYTDKGSICIDARRKPGETVRISVRDTGIGIPAEDIGKLFSPFQQIESTLTKKNKGTGLGLYLCKKLMQMMQGDIFVKSSQGKGSTFYIEMPVHLNQSL